MMGNRGSADALETDAFSRKSRGLRHWRRGALKKLKRAFGKRQRRAGKSAD